MTDTLRFGTDTPQLSTPLLLGLAAALVVAVIAVHLYMRGSDGMEVLAAPVIALMGLGGLYVGASWHCVEVDPAAREVRSRHGIFGLAIGPLSQTFSFADIARVQIQRQVSKEDAPAGAMDRRARYVVGYELRLLRHDIVVQTVSGSVRAPNHPVDLPNTSADLPALEAVALKLAALGGWPAERRGYRWQGSGAERRAVADAIEAPTPLTP